LTNKFSFLNEFKEAVRKGLFMGGDLQIAPTTGSKTADFQ